jgi:hypothetical protein
LGTLGNAYFKYFENLGKDWTCPSVRFQKKKFFFLKDWHEESSMMEFFLKENGHWSLSIHHTNLPVQLHYPKMGQGLVPSLWKLVWDTSQLSRRVVMALDTGLHSEGGNTL